MADTVSGTSVIPTPADFIVPQPRGLGMYLGGGPVSGTGERGVSDVGPQPTSRDKYLGEDTVAPAGVKDKGLAKVISKVS